MNLSTQLRIILLLVGAAIWLAIYLWGKRKAAAQRMPVAPLIVETPHSVEAPPGFTPANDLDDDEFETPAYMRRQGQREARQDYEPRIATAHDYVDMDEVRDEERYSFAETAEDSGSSDAHSSVGKVSAHAADFDVAAPAHDESIYAEPMYVEPMSIEPMSIEPVRTQPEMASTPADAEELTFSTRREPTVSLDENLVIADTAALERNQADVMTFNEPSREVTAEPPTLPNIPVVEHHVATHVAATQSYARQSERPLHADVAAPTLSEAVSKPTETMRTSRAAPNVTPAPASDSKSAGNTAARRKIIALRIPMPERVPGKELLSLLQSERLQYGKFNIFHRLHDSGTVFSVASMVEPGTFDPPSMAEQQFPGITLFMLLPGPLDGLVAYDQMLSCAQRLAHAAGGILQDERGSKLTAQTMERLREEVLDFQHLLGGAATAH